MHVLEQLYNTVEISKAKRVDITDDLATMIDEARGFWTIDWTDWKAMCIFIAERLEHYARRFREHAEAE